MLPWWIVLLVTALVAAGFAFTGIAGGAAGTAQVFLFIFIVISTLLGVARYRGRRRSAPMAWSQFL